MAEKLEPGCCGRCGYRLGPYWTEISDGKTRRAYHNDCAAIIGPRIEPPGGE